MRYPSIFNDVLGPVMRGPSSSHCAASLRIGRICRDLMDGHIETVLIQYDPNGSLATTHKSQGSDMGLFGGFLGWNADDDRLPNYLHGIQEAGIHIDTKIEDIQAKHPNTYKITLFNSDEMHEITAISTGGGMIEVLEIDGNSIMLFGDYYSTIIYTSKPNETNGIINSILVCEEVHVCEGRHSMVVVNTRLPLSDEEMGDLSAMTHVKTVKQIHPVLPTLGQKNTTVPFSTCEEMIKYNQDKGLELWELALRYESQRGGTSPDEVMEKMSAIAKVMRGSIELGLQGTQYHDRILGDQSTSFGKCLESNELIPGDVLNRMIYYISAIMEVKSSMGVIVAAPTAGSCGAMPGAVFGMSSVLRHDEDDVIKALLIAGLIGVFIAQGATFAAEVGGCQAECGSGSGMAAAALAFLAKGTMKQSLSAASLALQNSLGMICDPIANRVEAPCLGRNIMAASNALSCANMALASYDELIPLDEVIQTMKKVGDKMAHELRCTALGGLSITQSSKAIEARLAAMQGEEALASASTRFKIC